MCETDTYAHKGTLGWTSGLLGYNMFGQVHVYQPTKMLVHAAEHALFIARCSKLPTKSPSARSGEGIQHGGWWSPAVVSPVMGGKHCFAATLNDISTWTVVAKSGSPVGRCALRPIIWRFPEMVLPLVIIPFRIFHYKPSILGYPPCGNLHL